MAPKPYVRPSALDVAEFCPRSTELNELSGISRWAIISTAWHAKLAGNDTLVGELHPQERKEVEGYGCPKPLELDGVTLDYSEATVEEPVELFDGDDLLTKGTPDGYWVKQTDRGKWVYVMDNKRNFWSVMDGADRLQLAAYGHALCMKHSAMGYTPLIWSGMDDDWFIGKQVDLTSPEALDLWLRIGRAARNDHRLGAEGRHVTGSHCEHCWGRHKCPEYAALTSDGPVDVTTENAAELILKAKAMKELSERITENVKAFVQQGGEARDKSGKLFLPVMRKGQKSLDREALAKVVDLEKFQKVGKPYPVFDWRKA